MTQQEIIKALEELYGPPLGRCAEYTAAFAEAFPELKRVRGLQNEQLSMAARIFNVSSYERTQDKEHPLTSNLEEV